MLEDVVCRCRDVALGWSREARRTANLMIGQPDYDAYVRHAAERHPDQAPLDRISFFRLHEARRFGGAGGFRCC